MKDGKVFDCYYLDFIMFHNYQQLGFSNTKMNEKDISKRKVGNFASFENKEMNN